MSAPRGRFDDPGRPWGWWMTTDRDGFVVDEHGNRFASVRDALWRGRLGLAVTDEREAGVEMERLLAWLVSISREAAGRRERLIEVFDDDPRMPAFHAMWAQGKGLLDENGRLTVEGGAVMLMLAVTRDFGRGPTPLGEDEVPAAGAEVTPAEREGMFERAEAFGRKASHRFARGEVAGFPALMFSGPLGRRALPAEATIWTHVFHDEDSRDAMFHWLCLRVDRWNGWGAKTAHLGSG